MSFRGQTTGLILLAGTLVLVGLVVSSIHSRIWQKELESLQENSRTELGRKYYQIQQILLETASNASNASNSSNASHPKQKSYGDSAEARCAIFGGLAHCPDWIILDSPCSPAHPCKSHALKHHYIHPACQPSWVGVNRDGKSFRTSTLPANGATGTTKRRRRWRRDRSVDWYADGTPPSTVGSYPGRFNGDYLRWSPQPRPPYKNGFLPGTCEPSHFQGKYNGRNESVFNNGTAFRTCQCDLNCEDRRDCCCDVNHWRAAGRWAIISDAHRGRIRRRIRRIRRIRHIVKKTKANAAATAAAAASPAAAVHHRRHSAATTAKE